MSGKKLDRFYVCSRHVFEKTQVKVFFFLQCFSMCLYNLISMTIYQWKGLSQSFQMLQMKTFCYPLEQIYKGKYDPPLQCSIEFRTNMPIYGTLFIWLLQNLIILVVTPEVEGWREPGRKQECVIFSRYFLSLHRFCLRLLLLCGMLKWLYGSTNTEELENTDLVTVSHPDDLDESREKRETNYKLNA